MRNRIAWKLTAYFAVVLLIFAVGVGMFFAHFFVQHTIDIKKKEMQVRAVKIAEVIQDNMHYLEKRYGNSISNSRFIRYIDNVTMEDVWVVDLDRNLNVAQRAENRQSRPHRRLMQATPRAAYNALSNSAKMHINEVFQGESFTIEEYNPVLEDFVVTVGVPVYDSNENVKAVLLLNSSVEGMQEAAWEGVRILLISSVVALLLVFILSVVFSLHFTKPLNMMKEIAEKLADKDYSVKCNLQRNDEIGDLAKTIDILSDRLKLADEESQKLENMRREFIANISHELRTPVTVIRGSLEAILDEIITDPKDIRHYNEQMLSESVFLQRLINDLLDLSRLQNTDFPMEKETINICDVMQDVLRSSRQLGAEKNLQISSASDTDIYLITGDYGRLRQMLMIFLHNSIKFSDTDGSIEITLQGNELKITDHGCGIKKEFLPHAFDRFYKSRNEKNKSGSGLGLAIAKQIAVRHNIELELTSEENSYTTVTLKLPDKEQAE